MPKSDTEIENVELRVENTILRKLLYDSMSALEELVDDETDLNKIRDQLKAANITLP